MVIEGLLTGMADTLGFESWMSSPQEPLVKSILVSVSR
jgi:hypothetical protein